LHNAGAFDAGVRVVRHLPRARRLSPAQALASPLSLAAGAVVDAGYLPWFRKQRVLKPESKKRIEAALVRGV
jgi:hypothetical protein